MQQAQKNQQNNLEMLAHSGFWDKFRHDFQAHASNVADLNDWASLSLPILHSELLLNDEYMEAIARAENEVIEKNNLVIPIINSPFMTVNLIALKTERDLPLHDHPGSSGSMMVISGKVRTIICEQKSESANTDLPSVSLTVVENKIIEPGKSGCFTQEQHNIHSFGSVSDRAVVMVIHVPPFQPSQQSYFFTSGSLNEIGSQMLAQRIRVKTIQSFRKTKFKKLKSI